MVNYRNTPSLSRRHALAIGGLATATALTPTVSAHAEPKGRPLPQLVARGKVNCTILTDPGADANELQAATELQELLSLVSGVTVPRTGTAGVQVHVGGSALKLDPRLATGLPPHGFRVVQEQGRILMAGGSSQGTLYAAYDLLERLGFRFLAPGPHGTFVPQAPNTLRQGTVESRPHFSHRVLQGVDKYVASPYPGDDINEAKQWTERNRIDIKSFGAHGIPLEPAATKATNPELFIQENGVATNQLNVTLPEVLERAVAAARTRLAANPEDQWLNLGPADGAGFGETSWDVAGRFDPLYGELVVTDRYIKFFNLLLARLRPEFPDVRLAFYAYHLYMEPPAREVPDKAIVPVFAPIVVSRRNSIKADDGWERRYVHRVIREWADLGLEWMYRGYVGNLADPGGPFCAAGQLAVEVPALARAGARHGFRMECLQGWGYGGASYYLLGKLMWDPTLNPEQVLGDYFSHAYGRSAAAMTAYFKELVEIHETAPFTAGGIFDLLPSVGDRMTRLGSLLATAEARDTSDGVAARIRTVRLAHDAAVAQLAAQAALTAGEFQAGDRLARECEASYDTAATAVPAATYPFTKRYIPRFITQVATPAADREATVVRRLPERWQAQIDNTLGGEGMGFHLLNHDARAWTQMDTATRTWSAQGLRYLRGSVWYRTTVDVPRVAGPLRLWLASVDDTARVWVNGNECPQTVGGGTFLGREFDVSSAVRQGASNQFVVRVGSQILDEIGTGGLMGKAFLFVGTGTAPATALPPVPAPAVGPRPPAATAPGSKLTGGWELMVDPFRGGARLGLTEPGISSQHFRDVDPSLPWAEQGLGAYRGGVVLRTTFQNQPGSPKRPFKLWVPWVDSTWRAYLNEVEVPRIGSGFDVAAELSKVRGRRDVTLALVGVLDGGNARHGAVSLWQ